MGRFCCSTCSGMEAEYHDTLKSHISLDSLAKRSQAHSPAPAQSFFSNSRTECPDASGYQPSFIHGEKIIDKHTPTPWTQADGTVRIEACERWVASAELDPNSKGTEVTFPRIGNRQEAFANAAFIVRAVNCHEELVSVLKEIYEWTNYKNTPWAKRAELIISKAEGK